MSEFLIKSDILASKERELDAIAKKLKRYSNDIDRKRSSLDYKTKSANRLNSTLSTIANNVETCGNKSAVMSDKLSQAVKVYTNTERTIAGVKTQSTKSEKGKSGETKDTGNWALDALTKFLKKAGLIGGGFGIYEGVIKLIDSISSGKDILDILSAAVGVAKPAKSTISGLMKKIKNMKKVKHLLPKGTKTESWIKTLFGFDDYFGKGVGVASKAKSFSTRVYNNFQKSWAKEIGKGVAVSAIFSGIANIIENAKDAKDGKMSWGRAIQEMVGETAVDVVVGAAITAGVAAVAGATIGAPAILVGGTAALITMGLDGITKHFTNGEKDFSELVSDGLIDLSETVMDFNRKVGQVKQAVVTKATKLVTDACSKTIGAAGKFLGNVAKGFGITSKLKSAIA